MSFWLRRLLRRVVYRYKGYRLYPIRAELERSQFWSRAELASLQDEKLRHLIAHAYHTVPFYRGRMDALKLVPEDIRGVNDLPRLPPLTRADIRAAGGAILSSAGSIGRPIGVSTGGTLGEPLVVWNDLRGAVWGNAAYQRGLGWAGYDFDRDRMLCLFGRNDPRGHARLQQRRRQCSRDGLLLELPAYAIEARLIRDYDEAIRRFAPRFLKGYGGTVYLLARGLAEAGLPLPTPRAVFTTSEQLLVSQRRFIEAAFRTTVFDYYGCSEIASLGYECLRHEGYHIPEEHAVIEAVPDPLEPEGAAAAAFLITDLDNYYMPFLRYHNGDSGVLTDQPCPCGRTLRRIRHLHGKIADLLRSTRGDLVDGTFVAYLIDATSGIRAFCFTQETQTRCRLQFVAEETVPELGVIVERLKTHLGEEMEIITERVERIPLAGSGKRRYVRSLLHPNATGPEPRTERTRGRCPEDA